MRIPCLILGAFACQNNGIRMLPTAESPKCGQMDTKGLGVELSVLGNMPELFCYREKGTDWAGSNCSKMNSL